MPIPIIDVATTSSSSSFTISRWTGSSQGFTNPYYVTNGIVLSTFSYDTGTFIPVANLGNTPFEFAPNNKFYIEFTITPNLQVSGAALKCGTVGSANQSSIGLYPNNWPSYPSLINVAPQDVYDTNGRISILKNGKKQGKCYALLGYRSDDTQPNGGGVGTPPNATGSFSVVQCFNSDIIMVSVAANGTSVLVPMPYFNALNHYISVST